MKKTILYIGGFELPDRNAAAQRVVANAKVLRGLGYNVMLIGTEKHPSVSTCHREYEGFVYHNIKYPTKHKEWIFYLCSIRNIKMHLHSNVSHIIVYNYPSIALWRLKRWCTKRGVKLIGDCTEWYDPNGNFLYRAIKSLDVIFRMKYLHLKLDGLIVISDYLYEYYRFRVSNLINIPPLVDITMQKWEKCSEAFEKYREKRKTKFIYAGSPGNGSKDRLDLIIDLIGKLHTKYNDIFLTLIGITKEQFIASFRKPLPQNVDDYILFKGKLDHETVLTEIKGSDFYIFLRDNNLVNSAGFPTKFVESVSCGIPVITNTSSNISTYLEDNINGFLIDIYSGELIENKMEYILLLSQDELKKIKNKCESIKKTFHYENYMEEFDYLLKKCD